LSFDGDGFVVDVLGAEETVYGLNPSEAEELGLTLAWFEFDLLINVAFDMIGATFELFMLSFFVVLVWGGSSFTLVREREREEVGEWESNGIFSDVFIAFDEDDV
jgi:hypothetical protein